MQLPVAQPHRREEEAFLSKVWTGEACFQKWSCDESGQLHIGKLNRLHDIITFVWSTRYFNT